MSRCQTERGHVLEGRCRYLTSADIFPPEPASVRSRLQLGGEGGRQRQGCEPIKLARIQKTPETSLHPFCFLKDSVSADKLGGDLTAKLLFDNSRHDDEMMFVETYQTTNHPPCGSCGPCGPCGIISFLVFPACTERSCGHKAHSFSTHPVLLHQQSLVGFADRILLQPRPRILAAVHSMEVPCRVKLTTT